MDKDKKETKEKCGDIQKGADDMDTTEKRPSTILESIEDSFKQIKEVENGKRQFKTLKESRSLWKQWTKEADDDHR